MDISGETRDRGSGKEGLPSWQTKGVGDRKHLQTQSRLGPEGKCGWRKNYGTMSGVQSDVNEKLRHRCESEIDRKHVS